MCHLISQRAVFLIVFFRRQRPEFEEHSIETLKRPDITNVREYYTRSPGSGLWIYDFGSQFVGLIAVDASVDALSDKTASSSSPAPQGEVRDTARSLTRGGKDKSHIPSTSSIAVIRHFYVAEIYRTAVAQNDLITFAVRRVFESSSVVERIRMTPSPLMDYIGSSLKDAGFEVVERGPKVGLLGWATLTYELTREKWDTLLQKTDLAH